MSPFLFSLVSKWWRQSPKSLYVISLFYFGPKDLKKVWHVISIYIKVSQDSTIIIDSWKCPVLDLLWLPDHRNAVQSNCIVSHCFTLVLVISKMYDMTYIISWLGLIPRAPLFCPLCSILLVLHEHSKIQEITK